MEGTLCHAAGRAPGPPSNKHTVLSGFCFELHSVVGTIASHNLDEAPNSGLNAQSVLVSVSAHTRSLPALPLGAVLGQAVNCPVFRALVSTRLRPGILPARENPS